MRSADALGFRQPQDAKGKLEKEVSGSEPLRVRLVMTYRGKMEVSATPFEPVPEAERGQVRQIGAELDAEYLKRLRGVMLQPALLEKARGLKIVYTPIVKAIVDDKEVDDEDLRIANILST